jgi:glycosyltransferase involved in cell wall biosynthesis
MTAVRSLAFLVPGSLETPTGGYVYDRRLIEGLRHLGWQVEVTSLDTSFPYPTAEAMAHASRTLASVADGGGVIVDGLACGAMPDLIEREADRLRITALVHLPLAADITRTPQANAELAALERRALAAAALVIVTGPSTPALLAAYDLPHSKIVVIEPGTAPVPAAERTHGTTVTLLCVATLHPGKGHETLLEALAPLVHLDWQLICVGSQTRHAETAERVRAAIVRHRLEPRVSLVGEVDETGVRRWYDSADVFVLATLQETYGMAVAEALAHGLPVVSTTAGSIPVMVGADAGMVVPPGDAAALSSALACVIADGDLRRRLRTGAQRAAANRLRTWEWASRQLSDALDRLNAHG